MRGYRITKSLEDKIFKLAFTFAAKMDNNPFSNLFTPEPEIAVNPLSKKINDYIENVLLVTNNKTNKRRSQLVFVDGDFEQGLLTVDSIKQ